MPISNWTKITVRYAFSATDDQPVTGSVTFTPEVTGARLIDAALHEIVYGRTLVGTLSSTGTGSVDLYANDDPDLTPINWTYKVIEPSGYTYSILVPIASATTGIDLADLAPAGASAGTGATQVQSNDPRLTNTRTPTDYSVTNLKVATTAAIAESKLALASDAAADIASRRTLGTGANQAAAGNDPRLSDTGGGIQSTVRKLADDFADVNILVLGDSTAGQTGQFPDLLMPMVRNLYPHRTLQKATWDNTTHTWGAFAQVGAAGTGANKIKFWQGGVSGTVFEQPVNYFDTWVAGVQPDLALVHYGHNYGATAAGAGQPSDAVMDQVFRERALRFLAEIRRACPSADVLVDSQNPYLTAGARASLSNFRAQTFRGLCADLGMAYGPVLEAFQATGNPAAYLNADGLHPTTSGTTNGAQLAADALLPLFRYRRDMPVQSRIPSPFTVPAVNLLTNGDFIEFVGSTLTGWTAQNLTLAKDTTNYESNGYSVKGTGTVTGNCIAYQLLPIRKVRGRIVTFAARFYVPASVTASGPGRVQLSGGGGLVTVSSGTITNVRDNWVWAFVTAAVPASATFATASLVFAEASGDTASCDRAVVCLGGLPRDAAPRDALTTYVTQVQNTEDSLTAGQMVPHRDLMSSSSVSHTTGTMALAYFLSDKAETINNLTVYTGTTAAAATPTLVRLGVYQIDTSGNGTLVASTANDTTLLAAAHTSYTKALAAPFSKAAGQRYATALLVTSGVAMPTFMGPLAVANPPAQSAAALAPMTTARMTGQTDLPASFTAAAMVAYSLRSSILLS